MPKIATTAAAATTVGARAPTPKASSPPPLSPETAPRRAAERRVGGAGRERARAPSPPPLLPGTGAAEDNGPTELNLVLPRGAGSAEYRAAVADALPFLLDPAPGVPLICAGFDALDGDPLATMTLSPDDFRWTAERTVEAFPADRVALGLEGGYLLDEARGMPAALRASCEGLLRR